VAQRTVAVQSRADVLYTMSDGGNLRAWIVLADGSMVELTRSEMMSALDGDKARAALAQTREHAAR
jgi:hypothetical protein